MAQPIRNMAGSTRGVIGGAAQNIIEITSDDLVQNGGNYSLKGGTPLPMKIVTGRRSKQGVAKVVYPVDALGNYDPTFAGYIYKLRQIAGDNLIGLWPQNELAGGVSIDYSGFGHDGAYTAVTLGQPGVPGTGMTSAGYDGATSLNNFYSASLNTEFDGDQGTAIIPGQVANVGVWTDAVVRYLIRLFVDANNYIFIRKESVPNNSITFEYKAGGVVLTQSTVGLANIDFAPYGITWDISAGGTGEVRYYIRGIPSGAMDVGLGIWAGNLNPAVTLIGAANTGAASVYSGNLATGLLANRAFTPAEMLDASTP
jgi:hypothetical protein